MLLELVQGEPQIFSPSTVVPESWRYTALLSVERTSVQLLCCVVVPGTQHQ
jgi:hypothetical protein